MWLFHGGPGGMRESHRARRERKRRRPPRHEAVAATPPVGSPLDSVRNNSNSSGLYLLNTVHSLIGPQTPPMPTTYWLLTCNLWPGLPQLVNTSGPATSISSFSYTWKNMSDKVQTIWTTQPPTAPLPPLLAYRVVSFEDLPNSDCVDTWLHAVRLICGVPVERTRKYTPIVLSQIVNRQFFSACGGHRAFYH